MQVASVEDARIDAAAGALRRRRAALLLGARGLRRRGLDAAGRIAAASGCALLAETFPARMERGAGVPAVTKLPYFPEDARELLGRFESLVLAGAPSPVAFFGYPNLPSSLVPESCAPLRLAEPREDVAAALEALADALGAGRLASVADMLPPALATGRLTRRVSEPRSRVRSPRAPSSSTRGSPRPCLGLLPRLGPRLIHCFRSPAGRSARGCRARRALRSPAPTAP